MKYIKSFKMITESNVSEDLIDYVDDSLIDEFFDKNYVVDADEVAYLCSDCVWNCFNKEQFVEDFISDMKNDRTIEDFDDYDFTEYIKSHLTEEKKEKIIELYNDNNYDEDDDDSEKVTEYDEDYLEDLDRDQLIEVITVDDDESDFVEYITNDMYDGYTAKEILSEFYGMSEETLKDQNRYSYSKSKYDTFGQYLWKEHRQYIDSDKLVDNWKKNEDYEYRKEYTQDSIYREPELQRNILKNHVEAVIKLAEMFENETGDNISDEYDFQKAYIEYKVEQDADENDEDDVVNVISDSLEYLDDNFGLNKELEIELRNKNSNYFIKIDAKKYNM